MSDASDENDDSATIGYVEGRVRDLVRICDRSAHDAARRIADLELQIEALWVAYPEDTPKRWTVYCAHPADDDRAIFYIGITADFKARVSNHQSNPKSAVNLYARTVLGDADVYLQRIAEFASFEAARMVERVLIAMLPRLANRDIADHRNWLGIAESHIEDLRSNWHINGDEDDLLELDPETIA